MTVIAKCLLEAKFAESSQTTQYTVGSGTRTIVDKFTAYANAATSLNVNVVASGGTAGASNLKVAKTLASGETYTFPEIVGQILNAGDFLSTIAGTSSAVVIRASGREVT